MVKTRWNSCYYMIERLVEQKSTINLYFDENESEVENLTNQDYKLMVDLLKLLEPLEIATKELSGDKYSSLSLVIPILTQLHVEIAQLRFIDSTVKEVKQKLVDSIKTRFLIFVG